jgi:hypothetical protein
MGQSRRGVAQVLEAQVRPLIVVILRFIQLMVPLLLLKLMGQSRCGVPHMLEARVHPLVVAILRLS